MSGDLVAQAEEQPRCEHRKQRLLAARIASDLWFGPVEERVYECLECGRVLKTYAEGE